MRRSTSASAFRFSSSELNRVVDRTSTASASRVPSCVEPPAASCGGAASVGSPDTLSGGKRLRAVSSLMSSSSSLVRCATVPILESAADDQRVAYSLQPRPSTRISIW